MAKVTYEDKVTLNPNTEIADINKGRSEDWNELKTVINTNDDALAAKLSTVSTDASLNGDGTSGSPLSVTGGGLQYVELDITDAYNGFGDFNMPSTFNPLMPLYLRVEWTNTTNARVQQDDVMNFSNQNDTSDFADVTMNYISNVDANSTAAMVFLWTNEWSVGDLIIPIQDLIFDYRKVVLYQYK